MTEIALPKPHWKWTPVLALFIATALAIGLFVVVPLTQLFDAEVEVITLREMQMISAAPPKTPPLMEQQDLKQEEKPPELQKEFQDLSLQQLELSLNPGLGDAFAMGAGSMSLETEIDVVEEVERIFQFSELSNVPRIISQPRFNSFPLSMIRLGIKSGRVEMIIVIDKKGIPTVREIVSSSHPDLIAVAKNHTERTRYSVSKVEGKPVQVIGRKVLNLNAPKK